MPKLLTLKFIKVDKAIKTAQDSAKEHFEANEKVNEFHVTSDLLCFEKKGDATSHAQSLKDETVTTVLRSEVLEAEKPTVVKPEFTVAQMVEKFAAAQTDAEVDALIAEGETRKGVLDGAVNRKAELNK